MGDNLYGVQESNPISKGYHDEPIVGTLGWDSPDLKRITRLRLLSDIGFPMWDVSYCHGINQKGERVAVYLPFDQLPRGKTKSGKGAMLSAIVWYAKKDKVYARGLGIFDAISTLI